MWRGMPAVVATYAMRPGSGFGDRAAERLERDVGRLGTGVVRVGDAAYVRSARGPHGAWYRRALRHGMARIRAGGVTADVAFAQVPPTETETHEALDATYHAKCHRPGPQIVGSVLSPDAHAVTLRLDPTD